MTGPLRRLARQMSNAGAPRVHSMARLPFNPAPAPMAGTAGEPGPPMRYSAVPAYATSFATGGFLAAPVDDSLPASPQEQGRSEWLPPRPLATPIAAECATAVNARAADRLASPELVPTVTADAHTPTAKPVPPAARDEISRGAREAGAPTLAETGTVVPTPHSEVTGTPDLERGRRPPIPPLVASDRLSGNPGTRPSSPQAYSASPTAQADEIHIHIGRIEVTAVHEPAAVAARRKPRGREPMSLDEYLAKRQSK